MHGMYFIKIDSFLVLSVNRKKDWYTVFSQVFVSAEGDELNKYENLKKILETNKKQ